MRSERRRKRERERTGRKERGGHTRALRREKIAVPGHPPANLEAAIVLSPVLGPTSAIVAETQTPKAVPSQMMTIEVRKSSVK